MLVLVRGIWWFHPKWAHIQTWLTLNSKGLSIVCLSTSKKLVEMKGMSILSWQFWTGLVADPHTRVFQLKCITRLSTPWMATITTWRFNSCTLCQAILNWMMGWPLSVCFSIRKKAVIPIISLLNNGYKFTKSTHYYLICQMQMPPTQTNCFWEASSNRLISTSFGRIRAL